MKVSVVIPVYNSEKFLDACISSILQQNFRDLEILIVDDGSTDNSPQICDSYSIRDKRVKVFHKTNGGVSSARNMGIETAQGEWITFIDSDDFISEDYFLSLEDCRINNVDWIFLDVSRVTQNKIVPEIKFNVFELKRSDFLKNYNLHPHFPGIWGKLFNSRIIRENKLKFNEKLNFGEDTLFNLQYLFKCNIISSYNKGIYYYRSVENGLSYKKPTVSADKNFFNLISNILLSENIGKELVTAYLQYPAKRLFFAALDTSYKFKEKKDIFKFLIKNFKSELINYTKNKTFYLSIISWLLRIEQINFIIFFSNIRNYLKEN